MLKIFAAIFEQGNICLHVRLNLKREVIAFNLDIDKQTALHGTAEVLGDHLDKATLEKDKAFDADLRFTFQGLGEGTRESASETFKNYKRIMRECAKFLRESK